MLPSKNHFMDLYFGSMDLARKLNQDCLVVDCSTVSPLDTLEFSKRFREETGLEFLDAPVSGGTPGAMNATLTFMVGSETPELFEVLF